MDTDLPVCLFKNKTTFKKPLPSPQVRPPLGGCKEAEQFLSGRELPTPHKVSPLSGQLAQVPRAPGGQLQGSGLARRAEAAVKEGPGCRQSPAAPSRAQTPQSPPLPAPRPGPSIKLVRPCPWAPTEGQSEPISAAMSSVGSLPIGRLY